jgi:rare lipoprotein A (peptidoglycan hydrolase)
LVIGCAVAGLIVLSPKSEAMPSVIINPPSMVSLVPKTHQVCKGQIGMASWYGSECQGIRTASGELFDKDRLTAANRKLPLGVKVRVTNLKNCESAILTINDRGPVLNNRVIDVSWAAAKKLGFLDAGLAPVQVDILSYPESSLRQAANSRPPKTK